MTREERLKFCGVCKNQKVSIKQGIICKITNEVPQFEYSCTSYDEDTELNNRLLKIPVGEQNLPASIGKRFANFLIDLVCYYLFAMALGALFGVILALTAPDKINTLAENKLISYTLAIIAYVVYYTLFEAINGQTVGKMITGTRVVTENGDRPDFGTLVGRSFSRLIPFESFSFLGDGPGWHDSFSRTTVIDKKKQTEN